MLANLKACRSLSLFLERNSSNYLRLLLVFSHQATRKVDQSHNDTCPSFKKAKDGKSKSGGRSEAAEEGEQSAGGVGGGVEADGGVPRLPASSQAQGANSSLQQRSFCVHNMQV